MNQVCPLTAAPFAEADMMESAKRAQNRLGSRYAEGQFDMNMALYFEKAHRSWMDYMSILGCSTQTFIAELARIYGFDDLANKLQNVKLIMPGSYIFEGFQGKNILFKDLLGKEYKVTKSSFAGEVDWDGIKSAMMTLVKYDNIYYQNGMASLFNVLPDNKDKVYIDNPMKEFGDKIEEVIKKNRGRRIYYCKTIDDVSDVFENIIFPILPEDKKEYAGMQQLCFVYQFHPRSIDIQRLCWHI